jgi:hypothetical protein
MDSVNIGTRRSVFCELLLPGQGTRGCNRRRKKFLATQVNVSFSAKNLLLEVTAKIYYLSPCILWKKTMVR